MTNKLNKAYKTIGEVAKILNLKKNNNGKLNTYVLRFWEKQFNQIKPTFFGTNRRYYDKKTIDLLIKIQFLLKDQGMTIKGVKNILNNKRFQLDDISNETINMSDKNVRSGARKANLILNFIKGKKVDVAIRDLEFTRKKVALDIKKTVQSAVANAENNYQYDIDNLYVKEAYVGKSIVMKRFRPRAKGRAAAIKKPYSRVTVILEEKKQNEEKK